MIHVIDTLPADSAMMAARRLAVATCPAKSVALQRTGANVAQAPHGYEARISQDRLRIVQEGVCPQPDTGKPVKGEGQPGGTSAQPLRHALTLRRVI